MRLSDDSRRKLRRVCNLSVPFLLILILAALCWNWFFRESQRQDKWIASAVCGMLAYGIFLVWVLLGSKWPSRARWAVFAGTIGAMTFCGLALRISGVTGDLLPIVEWRWKRTRIVSMDQQGKSRGANLQALTNNYPQFLGPNRNGIVSGPELERDWKQHPPGEIWRREVGAAWSGFAIEADQAITQEQRGAEELVACYDLLSGRPVWAHADTARFANTIAGEGPRATPTISSNRVFALGGTGVLNCLELATGHVVWTRDTLANRRDKLPDWGVASSPLVTEGAVIVSVGGHNSALVAYDRNSGAVLWSSGNDSVHWSSPERVTLEGVRQILVFSENVSSYDEQSGKVLWQHPWRSSFPRVSAPLVLSGNRVIVSQGYGGGSELIEVSRVGERWRTKQVWKSIRLKSKFANLIQVDGFIYGLDDGALACIDAANGELKWKGDRFGHGQMILVGRLLLLMAESGDVVLLDPNPTGQRELARVKVFQSKTWNPPALAGDLLLVRNDHEAACLRLPLAP